jgi:alpha-glucosidase (family GH31 glycosyl hydrolase)
MYDYVRSHHFGVNNSEPYNWWKGRGIHLDFTNEEAKNWWYSQLDKVFTNGVYGWKVDQGEDWLGDFVETSKGKMSKEQFKPYYYDAMYDYTVSRKPEGIIIARPYSHQGGYASSVDKMNMGWCGDFSGDWQGLHNQIHDIYMSALRGYGAIGCEVGGFYMKKSDRQQFARYAQFGCMTACMINGGENGAFSNHLPWYHGKDIECIYRFCVSLHQELRPYMFSSIVDSHLHGGSLIRNVSFQEESHLVGSDIFTKPITTSNDSTSFHLPPFGHWINFWNGKKYNAGTKMHEKYQLSKFPLFIKSGAIIPLQINDNTTELGDSTMKNRNVFMIWPNGLSQRIFHLPVSEGIEYENVFISYDEHQGHFTLHSKNSRKYTIVFRNIHNIRSVKGATYWKYNKSSNCLRIDINTNNAEIAIL